MSAVGLNEATAQKYIREQEKLDLISDKLSTQEYVDFARVGQSNKDTPLE